MLFLSAVSFLSCLGSFVFANDAPSDVISLTTANFESVVIPEPLILVEFFAPWFDSSFHSLFYVKLLIGVDTAKLWLRIMRKPLRHSRKRTLSWPRSTVSPKQISVRKTVFRVTRMCFFFGISLPSNINMAPSTLKVYRKGEFTDYHGPRKADGIISYMVK